MRTKCEVRFILNSFSHSSFEVWSHLSAEGIEKDWFLLTSRTVLPIPMPALLISTLGLPCVFRISAQIDSTLGVSDTSHR
jgi:hypothetical protein